MALFDNLPGSIRKMYDEGLDEVLIFAIIFIIILISGDDSNKSGSLGILPIIIIAAFLLLFAGFYRPEGDKT